MKNHLMYFINFKKLIVFIGVLFTFKTSAQTLSLKELVEMPSMSSEKIEAVLLGKGWSNYHLEFVTDSNIIRKSWVISNKYNELKSYVQLYEFLKNPTENNISFQFSDRSAFENYKKEMLANTYKEATSKKKKKKKKSEDMYKEKQQVYYSEKQNSLIVLKEVFVYGMNAFVLYSYRGDSRTAQDILLLEKQ